MFSIQEIAFEESMLINIAEYEYGDYFKVALDSVNFLWRFYESPSVEAIVFLRFLSQVQKGIYLSLLSIIRKHDIQTNMMIRYSLESAALALYSMFNRNEDDFRFFDEDGAAFPTEMLGKAYKWLDKEFPDYSRSMKFMKDLINKMSSHGNITASALNTSFTEDDKMTVHFFDLEHKDITRQKLWWITNICFGFMDVVSKNNRKYESVKLLSNFEDMMSELYILIMQAEAELKKTEMYQNFSKL